MAEHATPDHMFREATRDQRWVGSNPVWELIAEVLLRRDVEKGAVHAGIHVSASNTAGSTRSETASKPCFGRATGERPRYVNMGWSKVGTERPAAKC